MNCLLNENYFEWVKFAMLSIQHMHPTKLVIAATVDESSAAFLRNNLSVQNTNYELKLTFENQYEFPGIYEVWKLAHENTGRDDTILYFHSKGITNSDHLDCLRFAHIYQILRQYDECVAALNTFPSMNKCVVATDDGRIRRRNKRRRRGFAGWYNFWYVRGSYVKTLEEPRVTSDRYYFERWLSYTHARHHAIDGDVSDCVSLSKVLRYNVGEFWHPCSS